MLLIATNNICLVEIKRYLNDMYCSICITLDNHIIVVFRCLLMFMKYLRQFFDIVVSLSSNSNLLCGIEYISLLSVLLQITTSDYSLENWFI